VRRDEPLAEDREENLVRGVFIALVSGLWFSSLAAVLKHGEVAIVVVPALAVFWSWVALGTCVGLFVTDRCLAALSSGQALAASLLTAAFSGACVFTGAHEHFPLSLRQFLHFNQDLVGYYLVWLQIVYFVVATLASLLISATATSIARLRRRRPAVQPV